MNLTQFTESLEKLKKDVIVESDFKTIGSYSENCFIDLVMHVQAYSRKQIFIIANEGIINEYFFDIRRFLEEDDSSDLGIYGNYMGNKVFKCNELKNTIYIAYAGDEGEVVPCGKYDVLEKTSKCDDGFTFKSNNGNLELYDEVAVVGNKDFRVVYVDENGYEFIWDNIGDENLMSIESLVYMRNENKKFFDENLIKIEKSILNSLGID